MNGGSRTYDGDLAAELILDLAILDGIGAVFVDDLEEVCRERTYQYCSHD